MRYSPAVVFFSSLNNMEKNLTVYPISAGDVLNIFANYDFTHVRIMDMEGNIVSQAAHDNATQWQMDIHSLASATYIVEVVYANSKTARSVFVKL